MRNNREPFKLLEKKEPLNKKSDSLLQLINAGIDIYHHCDISPELSELVNQRHQIRSLLKNKLSVTEIKSLTDKLKKIEPQRVELDWRYINASCLSDQTVMNELLVKTFDEDKSEIERILLQYKECCFYILHTATSLVEVAEEWLPFLENCVDILLSKVNKKSLLSAQLLSLLKYIQSEKYRIAVAMVLRIEAAFHYRDLSQDDALVYVYHRLIQSGALNNQSSLRTPRKSLDPALFSRFYAYIQDNGSFDIKEKLNTVVSDINSIEIETDKIPNQFLFGVYPLG